MIYHIFIALLFWIVGLQIYNKDFSLLFGQYNYKIRLPQVVSFIAALFVVVGIIITDRSIIGIFISTFMCLSFAFLSELLLSKHSISSAFGTILFRIIVVASIAIILYVINIEVVFPFVLTGWYVRNVKLGVPYRNSLILAKYLKREMPSNTSEVVELEIPQDMPVFAYAGNYININELPLYDVTNYKIIPNTGEDLIDKLQLLIDEVGSKNGGIIYFPKGRYMFNRKGKKQFLQINYSNIVLTGELDEKGRPLAELINCGSTVHGKQNPWLSPFFITTGESIQKSNIFFGLQFRKRKNIIMRSFSMSDPGSDGTILIPNYATKVIRTSKKGDDLLYVEDASKVSKYIMLGLYNTDHEASLLKDILGQDVIRPEWQAASRAGDEEAPSFQWLVEVKEVIDAHTIRLVQPQWRDSDIIYEPAVFNVPMLENIVIRNLILSSKWNGMFRHHGHKRYYSVAQAQEMDYGWNGINMKRVAHGNIENVIFENFTNPLYVMDSRNISCEHLTFRGHDGHQGVKIYEHACDNLFRDIVFYNHYADMMGGEGNAYGNVFSEVKYLNPCFKPVDFDFHGFSEGPMSPPSYNLFENIYGFAYINSSGSLHMAPSCARTNVWWNCYHEGEIKGSYIFRQKYKPALNYKNKIGLLFKTAKQCLGGKKYKLDVIRKCYKQNLNKKETQTIMPYSQIARFYTDFYLYGIKTAADMSLLNKNYIHVDGEQHTCAIMSLYDWSYRSMFSKGN